MLAGHHLYRHLTNQPRYEVPAVGKWKSLPTIIPQSYPASLAAKPSPTQPTSLEERYRQQLIKEVLDWIEGVQDQSLYKVARLELGLASRSDLLEQPINAVVQIPDRAPRAIPLGTKISQIFDEQAGALLILGAPGTGKTTLLLELAREQANNGRKSSWSPAARRRTMDSTGRYATYRIKAIAPFCR
jgi:hypothetical protein